MDLVTLALARSYTNSAIASAVASIDGREYTIVNALPATGDSKYIYLVPITGTQDYEEYIWISTESRFEKIGGTMATLLPQVTAADDGKVLMVVSGQWAAALQPSAEGENF